MSEVYNFLVGQIGKAFQTMATFQVLPGVSLLAFCITILVLDIIIAIVWINWRADIVFYGGRHRRDDAYQESQERRRRR